MLFFGKGIPEELESTYQHFLCIFYFFIFHLHAFRLHIHRWSSNGSSRKIRSSKCWWALHSEEFAWRCRNVMHDKEELKTKNGLGLIYNSEMIFQSKKQKVILWKLDSLKPSTVFSNGARRNRRDSGTASPLLSKVIRTHAPRSLPKSIFNHLNSEVCSEPCRTSKMELL